MKGTLFNSYPNVSGNFNDIKEAAEYISMDTLEYTTSGKKTYLFLREQIYESHPVIAGIRMYDSSGEWIGGHAVLTKKRAIE